MSTFVDKEYLGKESIIAGIRVINRAVIIIIINLLEYMNFSFDATLVM